MVSLSHSLIAKFPKRIMNSEDFCDYMNALTQKQRELVYRAHIQSGVFNDGKRYFLALGDIRCPDVLIFDIVDSTKYVPVAVILSNAIIYCNFDYSIEEESDEEIEEETCVKKLSLYNFVKEVPELKKALTMAYITKERMYFTSNGNTGYVCAINGKGGKYRVELASYCWEFDRHQVYTRVAFDGPAVLEEMLILESDTSDYASVTTAV